MVGKFEDQILFGWVQISIIMTLFLLHLGLVLYMNTRQTYYICRRQVHKIKLMIKKANKKDAEKYAEIGADNGAITDTNQEVR